MVVKVAVLDDWLGIAESIADWSPLAGRAEVTVFTDPIAQERAADVLADFDVLVPMRERMQLGRALLEALPRLKFISQPGYSRPHIDTVCCAERGITISGAGVYTPYATAELALGLMLAAQRQILQGDRAMRAGGFQNGLVAGQLLAGKTLGIVGLGNLGGQLAKYATALDMTLIAWSTNLDARRAEECGARLVGKGALFAQADIISLHLKYAPRNHHIVGKSEIDAMKPGGLLVNTARSGLVDSAALLTALNERRIRAAIDVFDNEPLETDHPLRTAPGTLLSPHMGFSVEASMHNFYAHSIENIVTWLDGDAIRVLPPD